MSSEKYKREPGFLKDGVYSLFSVLIPGLFLISIDLVSKILIEGLNKIPWWFTFVAVMCNIIVSRVFLLVRRKRSGFASLVRINFFVYLPVSGLLVFFLYTSPAMIVYVCMLLFIQWIITYKIFNLFADYMDFNTLIKNYPGTSLVGKIHNNALMIQGTYNSLKKLKKMVYRVQFVLFLYVTSVLLGGLHLNILSLLSSVLSIMSGLILGIVLNNYMDEYRFYMDGLVIDEKLKHKRSSHVFIILFMSLFLVLPFLGNSSLFSLADIARVFDWFIHLFPEKRYEMGVFNDMYEQKQRDLPQYPKYLSELQNRPPLFNLALVMDILGIIIVAGLVAGLVYFLFKPLFTQRFGGVFKGIHPVKAMIKKLIRLVFFLKKITREVAQAIKDYFRPLQHQHNSLSSGSKIGTGIKPTKMSIKKKIQKNRVLKAFVTLIQWGIKQKISFHPTLGPKEYVSFIIEKIPERKDILEFIADTFEEAVFSDHIIEALIIKKYVYEIKEIVCL